MPKYIISCLFENILKADNVIFDMEHGHDVIDVKERKEDDNNEEER